MNKSKSPASSIVAPLMYVLHLEIGGYSDATYVTWYRIIVILPHTKK